LHDKLVPNLDAHFFEQENNSIYRVDRIGWIRKMFDLSCAEYDRLDLDRQDPVADLSKEFDLGIEGLTEKEVKARLAKIEGLLAEWSKGRKLYGNLYDDLLKLKYLHQRYTNYLRWLRWKS
ncbi:MAG TPA: hypothetical protein PLL64_13945, partial [Rhodothermales bacterium]|nr:hypothetical protein [Rhodothermales bacterium]